VKTHHPIPQSELDKLSGQVSMRGPVGERRENFRRTSGHNQFVGRVTEIKVGGQHTTSIITADAAREHALKGRSDRCVTRQVHRRHDRSPVEILLFPRTLSWLSLFYYHIYSI
jgi:hypothetical protein